jgi:N-acetylneuraminate synthase
MKVKIGNRYVGDGEPCFIVAEVGINHNGDLSIAKKLIEAAKNVGCDAVKFQKRTVELVYNEKELAAPRESPFGSTNGDLKRGLEFGFEEYREIQQYCKQLQIDYFASCWDEQSVDFMGQFDPICFKIASATLTDDQLLKKTRAMGKPILLSTGMSTIEQIDHAVEILGKENLIILQCTSTYPCKVEELNLSVIQTLKQRYKVPVGYSGHEVGLPTTIAAVALGACVIERHITLDRSMWGSDHAASVEIRGFERLVREIRNVDKATGNGVKKVYESEKPIMKKLRRTY